MIFILLFFYYYSFSLFIYLSSHLYQVYLNLIILIIIIYLFHLTNLGVCIFFKTNFYYLSLVHLGILLPPHFRRGQNY